MVLRTPSTQPRIGCAKSSVKTRILGVLAFNMCRVYIYIAYYQSVNSSYFILNFNVNRFTISEGVGVSRSAGA